MSVETLLASKEVIVVTGSGGVGKTSVAAALGASAAARMSSKVLVLTVDPARRLATALGLESFGNVEKRVPAKLFDDAGVEPVGELWIAMLDTKASWDDLIADHAPDEATRESILANKLYRNITGRFVQSHDYIAMERLHEIHTSGRYDLVIVDTPPTRNALDFLDAPDRMADFFSSRLLRWLIAPARSRLVNAAAKPFTMVADRLLGARFLTDIGEFFLLFQTLYDGFVERATSVKRTLADSRTSFVVVTTPEPGPASEARFLLSALAERDLQVGAIVANRLLPEVFSTRGAATSAKKLRSGVDSLAATIMPSQPEVTAGVLREIADRFDDFRLLAAQGDAVLQELPRNGAPVVGVPYLETEIVDLAGVLELGDRLWDVPD
ncbi:MAG: ArsA-related P-loop ATPase [Acidimicrobiales bacterium]